MPLPELRQAAVKRKQALFPVRSIRTNKMIGVLSKTDLVDPPRTRVALVDHNEFSQAVKGVEEAEIVEVMDHHRLGTQLSTRDPIRFLNEPVGSTSTLVARRFYHRDAEPSQAVAICLCAGILSDTLNLTSPTTGRGGPGNAGMADRHCQDRRQEVHGGIFCHRFLLRSKTAPSAIVQADRKTFTE